MSDPSGTGGFDVDRRELFAALLGTTIASSAGVLGCRPAPTSIPGELLTPNFAFGHQLRDKGFDADEERTSRSAAIGDDVDVAVIGGGVAGLSAAWHLGRTRPELRVVVLELEAQLGGTSQCGQRGPFRFPWGAHYLPVPMPENEPLIELLEEMGILEARATDGSPIVKEQFLCREPEERLFVNGRWQLGLFPRDGATDEDLRQHQAFRAEIDRWVRKRDESGRRMFAVPIAAGSDQDEVRQLDRLSVAAWMDAHGWASPRIAMVR